MLAAPSRPLEKLKYFSSNVLKECCVYILLIATRLSTTLTVQALPAWSFA
jgi:hypothetical protein